MIHDKIPYIDHDLTGLKIGDRLWTIQSGWTFISSINFKKVNTEHGHSYFLDGKKCIYDLYPSAFVTPLKDFDTDLIIEHDEVVLVWDDPTRKFKRHFAYYKNGYCCYNNGRSSKTIDIELAISKWRYCKKLTK